MKTGTCKNTWDEPYTGRVWHECGSCRGRVSAKSTECRHCGALFFSHEVWEKLQKAVDEPDEPDEEESE